MNAAVIAVIAIVLGIAGIAAGFYGLRTDRSRRRTAPNPAPTGIERPMSEQPSWRPVTASWVDRPVTTYFDSSGFISVTPEAYEAQMERMQVITSRWTERGMSTQPANRKAAEEAIYDLYQERELEPPSQIIWATSPFAAAGIAKAVAAAADAKRVSSDVLISGRETSLMNRRLMGRWSPFTPTADSAALRAVTQIGRHVITAATAATTNTALLTEITSGRLSLVPGQFDAMAIAQYEMTEASNGSMPRGLHAMCAIARYAGPWIPFDRLVIVSERPTSILLDNQQRLHSASGRAVTYPDGWGIHAWHGTRVPAGLIEGAGWTVEQILREPNTETRRAAVERIGWDRFIVDAGLIPIGLAVPDPGNPGQELALYDIPGRIYRNGVRVLLCTNGSLERDGTRRQFGLTVPVNFTDPVAAAAWTFNWTRDQYAALEHRR
jgi:hypothetical protein